MSTALKTPHDLLLLIEHRLTITPEVPVNFRTRSEHGLKDDEMFMDWASDNGFSVEPPLFTGLNYILKKRM